MRSSRRSYDQCCGIARAIALLGERWGGPGHRELMLGPKRYTELLDRLPADGWC